MIAVVNTAFQVWARSTPGSPWTRMPVNDDLNALFGYCESQVSPFGLGALSDPSVDYDPAHQRFVITAIAFDQLTFDSSLCIGVTTGAEVDPSVISDSTGGTGNWYVYNVPVPSPSPLFYSALLDFPRAVVSSDPGTNGAIYVAGNLFLTPDFGLDFYFYQAQVYAFPKLSMYEGQASITGKLRNVGNNAAGLPADSLTPARAVGAPLTAYFLSADNNGCSATGPCSTISLWRWYDPFGADSFTLRGGVTVTPYSQPPDADQPGSPGSIATNDVRNLAAYWSGNAVFGAHTIAWNPGTGTVPSVQWYQLGNLDAKPILVQQNILSTSGEARYFPSLAVDTSGNLGLAYAYSSPSAYAGIRATGVDAAGTVGVEAVIQTGVSTIDGSRYGDFAGTALDPGDGRTFWHFEEYADGSQWGTWVGAFQVAPAPDFTISSSPTSQTVAPGGQTSYAVALSARNGYSSPVTLSVSGLPGSGALSNFPISGVSPTSSTTLTVTTTTGVTPGKYTLTITGTGADGTSHSTSATLTVATPDFTIAAGPSLRTVSRGHSTTYTVTLTGIAGYTSPVSVSVTNPPSGISSNPITITPSATGASGTLTVTATSATKRGTYTLTITGTGPSGAGTITHTTQVQLKVK
jgi:hypothetical protein